MPSSSTQKLIPILFTIDGGKKEESTANYESWHHRPRKAQTKDKASHENGSVINGMVEIDLLKVRLICFKRQTKQQ